LLLVISSGHCNKAGPGVMVQVLDPGVQAEKCLRPFLPLELLLLPFLTPCRTMRLFDDVVAA